MLDDVQLRAVDRTARAVACRHGRYHEIDDFVAEARALIVAEIRRKPSLSDAAPNLLSVIARRRLIDWYRRTCISHRNTTAARRPDAAAISFERLPGFQPTTPPEDAKIDLDAARTWLIELGVSHSASRPASRPDPWQRWSIIVDGILNDEPQRVIANRLDISDTRVCQLVADLKRWAQPLRAQAEQRLMGVA